MSQPPTLFPKSPLGSAQNSGNGSSAGGATTPAEQRPRLGVTPTPGAAPAAPAAKPVAPAPWTIRPWSDRIRAVWSDNSASSRANWSWAIRARPVRPGANSKASVGVCPAPARSKPRACCGRLWCHTVRAKRTRDQRHAPAAHACCGFSLAHASGRQHPRSLALPQGFADIGRRISATA